MYLYPAAESEGTYTPDNLLAGDKPVRCENIKIAEGEDLVRGSVLGVRGNAYDDTEEYVLSVRAATDGSQTPVGILAIDVDATDAAVSGVPMYREGDFNVRALTFGTGHDAETVKAAFRNTAIHIQESVSA